MGGRSGLGRPAQPRWWLPVSGLVFLLAALTLSVIGSLVLWLRHRQPTSLNQGIDDFSREMQALAPPSMPPAGRRAREQQD